MKRNVNYAIQFTTFFWQISKGKQFSIFYKHIQVFIETNKELQQFKHCQSYIIAIISAASVKLKIITVSSNHSLKAKIIIIILTIPVTSAVSVLVDDFMNLNSAITAI